MIRSLALACLALASPAGAFQLAFPADCSLGDTCYIQQYADHEPGPGADDFTCGSLSYEGHDGTDIALPSRAAMAAGVDVLAAAPGIIKGTRDGVADFAPVVPGKECGNGVVIDHADGWQTQYCHMKQGSVLVHGGDKVEVGTPLGQIGQSGMAEFPHVHLTVRHNGAALDPFAPDSLATCGTNAAELWATSIPYQPGGLISIGVAPSIPEYAEVKAGRSSPDLPADSPALVVWAFLYGSQAEDVLNLSLRGPEAEIISEQVILDRPQAQVFRAVGKKLRASGWPPGDYIGEVTMNRAGQTIGSKDITIKITP